MLRADIQALQSQILVNTLAIREKELKFFTTNLNTITTSASLLFTLAVASLTQVTIPTGAHELLIGAYAISMASAIGLEMAVLVTSIFASMYGPNLALRGPEGSMDAAVDGEISLCTTLCAPVTCLYPHDCVPFRHATGHAAHP
jgi:hypothetical protein